MNDQSGQKYDSGEQSESSGIGIVIAAVVMGLCCLGPVLFATVGFAALSAWFFDSGVLWAIVGLATAFGLLVLYRRGNQRKEQSYVPTKNSKTNES